MEKNSSQPAVSAKRGVPAQNKPTSGKPKRKQEIRVLAPIILAFFVSGIVAMIGSVSNSVQEDFKLSDAAASFLAMAIYIWFVVVAVPTGYIMNKLGHKKTVLVALVLSCVSMLLPIVHYSYWSMLISLSILGIANTMLQISLNLLVSDVTPKRQMSSMLTLGQFVGQIPAMLIPVLALLATEWFGNWHWVYPLFLVISLAITYFLYKTDVEESKDKDPSGFLDLIGLLKKPMILFCFLGIICQVGIDVGIGVTTPKILIERIGMGSVEANFVTSVYAIVRLAGCLLGAFLLARYSNQKIYMVSLALLLLGGLMLTFIASEFLIYVCAAIMGLGISNIFAIIFSQALEALPKKKNDISVLMIMGLVGGAIFPVIMSLATKAVGGHQWGAVLVILLCSSFMLYKYKMIKDE